MLRPQVPPEGMSEILFVQVGVGVDQHGQDVHKAARKAVCAAICNNACVRAGVPVPSLRSDRSHPSHSIPHVEKLVPGGDIHSVKIHVKLGVPAAHSPSPSPSPWPTLQECFPYGKLLPVEVVEGGLVASSGTVLRELEDATDQMIIVVAAVTVGY